jgi:hypothetical protein
MAFGLRLPANIPLSPYIFNFSIIIDIFKVLFAMHLLFVIYIIYDNYLLHNSVYISKRVPEYNSNTTLILQEREDTREERKKASRYD